MRMSDGSSDVCSSVRIDGVAAEYVTAPLEEIFARAFDEHSYDVTELSFSNYLYLTATEGCPYVGLPVFPSRSFRHSAIYVRTDRGIRSPRDLAGRLVGEIGRASCRDRVCPYV